jgi:hypothetical protein
MGRQGTDTAAGVAGDGEGSQAAAGAAVACRDRGRGGGAGGQAREAMIQGPILYPFPTR